MGLSNGKIRRLNFQARGLCGSCGKGNLEPGYKTCFSCRQYVRRQQCIYRKRYPERVTTYWKTRRSELIRRGLCVCCAVAPAKPKRKMCPTCLGIYKRYQIRYCLRQQAAGKVKVAGKWITPDKIGERSSNE